MTLISLRCICNVHVAKFYYTCFWVVPYRFASLEIRMFFAGHVCPQLMCPKMRSLRPRKNRKQRLFWGGSKLPCIDLSITRIGTDIQNKSRQHNLRYIWGICLESWFWDGWKDSQPCTSQYINMFAALLRSGTGRVTIAVFCKGFAPHQNGILKRSNCLIVVPNPHCSLHSLSHCWNSSQRVVFFRNFWLHDGHWVFATCITKNFQEIYIS